MDIIAHTEPVDGFPSFIRRFTGTIEVSWWSPVRSGNAVIDYETGKQHVQTALDMLAELRDPWRRDLYRAQLRESLIEPAMVLSNIVDAMLVSGPIERGFIEGLTLKAMVGRAPSCEGISQEYIHDAEFACDSLELARLASSTEFVSDHLVASIDQSDGVSLAFIRTICSAAFAGASN